MAAAQLSAPQQKVSEFLSDILNLEAIEVGFNCFLTHRPEITKANEVNSKEEFLKLITEERYVVALFCPSAAMERCEEFEGELTSIREDMIDVLDGDGWVVKLVDSPVVEEYAVGKTDQPVIVMFRTGLPVLYDGRISNIRLYLS